MQDQPEGPIEYCLDNILSRIDKPNDSTYLLKSTSFIKIKDGSWGLDPLGDIP